MAVADVVGRRSKCSRAKVGTVIVDMYNRVIATGYAGPPANMPVKGDCGNWCPRAMAEDEGDRHYTYEDCVSTHSEMNALLFGDKRDIAGGTLYCNGVICYSCAKVIANCGVERVVMRINPTDMHRLPERTVHFLRQSLIMVDVLES